MFLLAGVKVAGAAVVVALGLTLVCFGIDDEKKAARFWLQLVIGVWSLALLWTWLPTPGSCGPDDPAGCSIRR